MAQDFTVDRASSKWVLGPDGVLIQYAADEPAIEFNADGSYKGVLVEPASTNEVLYSNTFSNTWWRKVNVTVSSESNLKFDTVWELKDSSDASNTYHFLGRISDITTTSNSYSRSIFLKKGTHKKVIVNTAGVFAAETSTSVNGRVLVDLDLGIIIDSRNTDNIKLQNYGDGWYRLSFARDVVSVVDKRFSIIMCEDTATDVINDQTYTGDGTGTIYIANTQLEESPIATSYIPTTTGSVTRVKDDIYITGASSLIGQTEGTLYLEVDWRFASSAQFLLSLSDNSYDNRVHFFVGDNQLDYIIEVNNASATVGAGTTTLSEGVNRFALSYENNGAKSFINGSAETTTTPNLSYWATNPSLSYLDFGQRQSTAATQLEANMHIRTVAIYKTRLSDDECRTLTGGGFDSYEQMAQFFNYTIL